MNTNDVLRKAIEALEVYETLPKDRWPGPPTAALQECRAALAAVEQAQANQCDGCVAGHTLRDGVHLDGSGRGYMVCQRERYQAQPAPQGQDATPPAATGLVAGESLRQLAQSLRTQYAHRLSPPWTVCEEWAEVIEEALADMERDAPPAAEREEAGADEEETYKIGYRDGYDEAVQDIDVLTGGDGEYRYCTDHDPDRHTPDAAAMKRRIEERFDALRAPADAQDAARYRWLRSRDLDTISKGGVFAGMTPENVVLNGPDLDAAIDKQRAGGGA